MSLPTLIFVAVLLPLGVLAVVWLLGEAIGRLAPRPRLRGTLFAALGFAYLASAVWIRDRSVELALRLAMGVLWIVWGVWEYRRGEVGSLD